MLEKDTKLARREVLNALSMKERVKMLFAQGQLRTSFEESALAKEIKEKEVQRLKDFHADILVAIQRKHIKLGEVQHHVEDSHRKLVLLKDEMSARYDAMNTLTALSKTAELSLAGRDDELRFAKLQVLEHQRCIDVLRARRLENMNVADNLTTHQIDLLSAQSRCSRLESDLTQPSNDNRWRQLGGSEPELADLARKMEHTERRLAAKEASVLERDLVLSETTRLVNRARKQLEGGRSDTIVVGKSVSDYQKSLRDVSRKMMAQIAELSMYMANAMKGQQGVHERQQDVEMALERLARNEAPTEEAARDWEREVRRAQSTQAAEDAAQHSEDSISSLQRPNAYMPDITEELPIARPYGPFAPYKPTTEGPGNNIRHIRRAAGARLLKT